MEFIVETFTHNYMIGEITFVLRTTKLLYIFHMQVKQPQTQSIYSLNIV